MLLLSECVSLGELSGALSQLSEAACSGRGAVRDMTNGSQGQAPPLQLSL